jgi:hypothetical protein
VSSLYAYVDESVRPGRYVMCSLVVEPGQLGPLRRLTRDLLLPGQRRLHFHNESDRRQRDLATQLCAFEVDVSVFVCRSAHGRSEPEQRACCLRAIVEDLQDRDEAVTLFLETRHEQDADDHGVIRSARRPEPVLTYQHLEAAEDPLLWLPDAYAWLVGAGAAWRRRIEPAIRTIREVP